MKIKCTKKAPAEKVVTKKAATVAAPKPAKTVKKPVTFTVHADKGKAVYVAGEFNNWDPTAKKMAYKARKGIYEATLNLAAGSYQYKFVIDGTWCADPENAEAVANDQGTFNSVVTVK
jgi:1,4-alpha-glucan branching enzyme